MTYMIIIYTASGRNLSEKHATKEQCIEAMEKIGRSIDNDKLFWFGRSMVSPQCIEAFFVTEQNGQEFCDDESRRMDPAELIEGHGFPVSGMSRTGEPVVIEGMWRSIRCPHPMPDRAGTSAMISLSRSPVRAADARCPWTRFLASPPMDVMLRKAPGRIR